MYHYYGAGGSALRGLGQGGCEEGEEFDLTSMMCVTAGQARTPVPSRVPVPTRVPTSLPPIPVPTQPPGPPPPPPPPPPDYTMWLIGGAVVIGVLVVAAAARSATPNRRRRRRRARRNGRRRPPKKWMRDCVRGASKSARDPGAVCGSLWHHKMTYKQRMAAKRRSYGR